MVSVPAEFAPPSDQVVVAREPALDLVKYLFTLRQVELTP